MEYQKIIKLLGNTIETVGKKVPNSLLKIGQSGNMTIGQCKWYIQTKQTIKV